MLSQTAEYSLRATSLLASRWPEVVTTGEIAKAARIPSAYLSKVLQALKRAGIITSQRGIGGGVCLAAAPGTITILEIINAVDPIRRITKCPIGLAAHGVELCPMHSRLDSALELVERVFRETTLGDLQKEQSGRARRCNYPSLKQ